MRFWRTTVLLALFLFLLSAIDFVGLSLAAVALSSPIWLLLASLVSATVLSFATVGAHGPHYRLVLAIFLVHYGVTYVMTAVEAVYLEELRSVVVPLLANGLITAGLFAPVAVSLHIRETRRTGSDRSYPFVLQAKALAWKLPLLSILWMLLFALAGALVFLPVARLAAPELLAGYTDIPAWVLPFQGVRAILWLLLALPMLNLLGGNRLRRALVLGTLFAGLMGSNLLLPNELMPAGLQLAHLAEVALANMLFGFTSGWLLLARRPVWSGGPAAGPVIPK